VKVGYQPTLFRQSKGLPCSEQAAKFLETVSSTIAKLKTHRAETCVIVEGAAQFQDKDNQTSSVASCDVFQFSDG
jgi:uncharacterized cupin superfamily protein